MKPLHLAACAGLLVLAGSALAQDPAPPPAPQPVEGRIILVGEKPAPHVDQAQQIRDYAAAQRAKDKPFSLSFPGGPVQAFIEAVEKARGEPFNVIVPDSAQDLVIPPVNVKEVRLQPLLTALSSTSAQQVAVRTENTRGPGMPPSFNVNYHDSSFIFTPAGGAEEGNLWQLQVSRAAPLPPAPAEPRHATFHSIKPLLAAGMKVEDLVTVLKTTWSMLKLSDQEIPELKVHEETGILIAVGSGEGLSMISSVLQMAGQGAGGMPGAAGAGRAPVPITPAK